MVTEADFLTPSSTLQAVNVIMEAFGQAPVASLINVTNLDAETALNRLYETSREVQEEGWHWNQEIDYKIDPNVGGEIVLPYNCLKVKKVYFLQGHKKDLVVRGDKLYDRIGHTFNVGVTATMDMTIALPFEDIPEAARRYITVKAARRMASAKLHSTTAFRFTKVDEDEARMRVEQADAETDQRTLHNNPHIRRMRRW